MKYLTRRNLLLVVGLLAIFLIPFLWYQGHEIIIGGDLTFPLRPAQYFLSIFQIWRRVLTGSDSAISLTTLTFYAPMALFDALGFSLTTVQKLHFGFWLAAPAISMFYFSGVLFKDRPNKLTLQLAATTIYLFNTYEVVWVDSARMAIWLGMPVLLAFFMQGLEDKKYWWRWAAGIAIASLTVTTAAANPPMFLMFLALFGFWLIYHFAIHAEDRSWSGVGRILAFILTALFFSLLINLYWIVPYFRVLLQDYSGALSSGLAGINFQNWLGPFSADTSLLNVFRLQGAWDWYAGWHGEPYVPAAAIYQHNVYYLAWSVIVPLLAFGALLVSKKKTDQRLVLYFAIVSLLGIFFGAGLHLPTGAVYSWLVRHVQFLSIYRSPWYKFSTWTVLGYSVLAAVSVATLIEWLQEFSKRSTIKASIAIVVTLTFIGANLIYSSGLVLGKVFPTAKERKNLNSSHITFPSYFFSSANWINSQSGDWRILQLPADQAFIYRWGLGTLMDMSIFTFNKPTLWWPEQTGSGPASSGSDLVTKMAYQALSDSMTAPEKTRHLLGLLNIRYLLEKQDIDYAFYRGQDSPAVIAERMNRLSIPLVHADGPWQFYELPAIDQQQLIFTTSQVKTLNRLQDLSGQLSLDSQTSTVIDNDLGTQALTRLSANSKAPYITYDRMSSSHYRIVVRGATTPYLLNFLESYDSGWQASTDGRVVAEHFRTFGYANGWVMPAKDGVIDLIYRPQITFEWMLAISSITLLILIALVIRRRNDR